MSGTSAWVWPHAVDAAQAAIDLIRIVLALLILLLPGLALGWALSPGRLSITARVILGIGASLACAALGGLLLDRLGALHRLGWAVLFSIITALAAVCGGLRRGFRPVGWRVFGPSLHRPRRYDLPLLLAAAGIATGAILLARAGAEDAEPVPYTAFWAVPQQGRIVLGIRNREGMATDYRVELKSGHKIVGSWDVPTLPPGASIERSVNWTAPARPADRTEALLYRKGHDEVIYRHVSYSRSPD